MEIQAKKADELMSLPDKESLSPFSRDLLNESFKSVEDLSATPSLVARLESEIEKDNVEYRKVKARLLVATAAGVSFYGVLTKSLHKLALEIENFRVSSLPLSSLEKSHLSDDERSDLDVVSSSAEAGVSSLVDFESSGMKSIFSSEIAESGESGDFVRNGRAMAEELEALASGVARVERVRVYAETVLKLEQLVGDLEASLAIVASSGRSQAQVGISAASLRIMRSVKAMQAAESAVSEIAHAHWDHLVSAVDLRIDRVVAILRPAAIADYRGLLTTIGWPPPFSAASPGSDKLENPLLAIPEEKERKYCQSFMALTILQTVQQARRRRQLSQEPSLPSGSGSPNTRKGDVRRSMSSIREPLWAISELVSSVALKAEPHFIRWTTKPELVFALTYRVAQEYVDVIDEFLQPLIDDARLAGYSAREEWIFSLVPMVSLYLQAHVLPGLANDLHDEGGPGSVGAALWLHIVDQALAFDSRMKSLAVRAPGLFQTDSIEESQGEDLENLSGPVTLSISAIADRPDWLALWAKLELEDFLEKLKAELQNDRAWAPSSKSTPLFNVTEQNLCGANGPFAANIWDSRAPPGANFVLSSMSAVTDRCRSLKEPDQQYRFIKAGVVPIAGEYLLELLRRCQELEAMTALADEESMVKVSTCVNAARYCEHALQDWGEDVFFLGLLQMQQEAFEDDLKDLDGSIFSEEIEEFRLFRQDWLGKLVSSVSRGFEVRCRDYLRNKKRWSEVGKGITGLEFYSKVSQIGDSEKLRQSNLLDRNHANILEAFDVSASFVDALAMLQSQLRILPAALGDINFSEFWRSVASSLDQLLMNSVVFSGSKFSEHGGWQFAADVQALLLVFKPFCVRPSAFFKTLHDAVKLLTLPSQDALAVLQTLASSQGKLRSETNVSPDEDKEVIDSLKRYGVRKLPPSSARRILSSRMLPRL